MDGEIPWRGLWHPSPPGRARDEMIVRAVAYFVTPLALALLFGEIHSLHQFGGGYIGSFIVGTPIAVTFELLYSLAWTRIVRRKPSWPARIAGHVATMAIAVAAGGLIANVTGRALLGWPGPAPVRLWVQGVVVSSVLLCVLVTLDEMRARALELERRAALQRTAAVRAELAALQARTDPHFLFNSLNTVAALVHEDPALAETLLVRLSAVFRYALDAGRTGTVALDEELAAVTAYLEVEALRLGPRLAWRLERDVGLDAVRVPPLVLQPLVENAIRHGAGARRGATEVVVSAHRRGAELVLAVEDQGAEPAAAATGGAGTALADLRARLALAYPDRARLDAGAAPPAGWRAQVIVPLENRA